METRRKKRTNLLAAVKNIKARASPKGHRQPLNVIVSPMKPSQILQKRRDEIRRIILAHDAVNPRVFGSVARGEDNEQSDLDVLVDPIDGKTSLVTLIRLKRALESALGVKADVLTPLSINERYRDRVLNDARAI